MTGNDLFAAAPALMKTSFGTSAAINSSIEPSLAELVKIRASQINDCANCINMHAAEAREKGETEQGIYLLPAWREAPCYTPDKGRPHRPDTFRLKAMLGYELRVTQGHDKVRPHLAALGQPHA